MGHLRKGIFRSSLVTAFLMSLAASLGLTVSTAQAGNGPSGFSYEGRLYGSSGVASNLSVQFVLEIYNPSATCLLRREQTAIVDLSQSDGYFSVTVGQGTAMPGDPGLAMTTVFANSGTITGGSSCAYTPVAGDGRTLRVSVYDGTTTTPMIPNIAIGTAPFAMVADTLQGKTPADLLQVNTANAQLSQANLESVFGTSAKVTELQALATGSSNAYMKSSGSTGTYVPTYSGTPGSNSVGQFWYDSTAGNLKYWDGSAAQVVGSNIWAPTASTVGLTVKGAPGQTSNLQEWKSNGGAVLAQVTNAGSVGIGTTPTATLHLKAGTATAGTAPLKLTSGTLLTTSEPGAVEYDGNDFWLTNSSARSAVAMNGKAFSAQSGSAGSPSHTFGADATTGAFLPVAGQLALTTSGGERVRIDSSGNVGIGTTSPATMLDVFGTAKASGLTANWGNSTAYASSGGSATGPGGAAGVSIVNYNPVDSAHAPIRFSVTNSASTTQNAYITSVSKASSYSPGLAFGHQTGANAYAERMRIDSNGNVGIGTTAPAAKLEVGGTVKFGTSGGTISGMGTCTITGTSWSPGGISRTCTGVPAGAMLFCTPVTVYTGQTYAAVVTAADTATIIVSVGGGSTNLNCYWVLP